MNWYYALSGKQYGPLTEDEFNQFVADGTIQSDTLVWRSGLDHWIKFGDYVETIEPEVEAEESDMRTCAECGNLFPESEMIPFKELWVCGSCKPLFIQKVREGAPLPGIMEYGGFLIRFAAKFIDGIILLIVDASLSWVSGSMAMKTLEAYESDLALIIPAVTFLLQMVIAAGYSTWFVGKHGATPGKMACRLRIVRSDGTPVGFKLAFGRHLAEYISYFILCIGYLIAAFDDQKRTLHDRICDTRVVVKQ